MRHFKSLRSKMILIMLVSFLSISLPALLVLFDSMNRIVFEKVREIDDGWVEARMEVLDSYLESLISITSTISQSEDLRHVLSARKENMRSELVEASESLRKYVATSSVADYINKAVVFRDDGVFFEYVNRVNGDLRDVGLIAGTTDFQQLVFPRGANVKLVFSHEINNPSKAAIATYSFIPEYSTYIYLELSISMLDDIFRGNPIEHFQIRTPAWSYPDTISEEIASSSKYKESRVEGNYGSIEAVYFTEKKPFGISSQYGLTALAGTLLVAATITIATSWLLTKKITLPVARLNSHILYLTVSNDYGKIDKEIQKGGDEIARIGRTVNKMSVSIRKLLDRNEALWEEKKDAEIAMLTMQINPHFLYNTLESIHYMAEIQRNKGIAEMSRGLSNLLKNMAKGNGSHIPLSDEIHLIEAYDSIQQVRYMGMYDIEYDIPEDTARYRIIKFTLQPLVENAIFHGIEPKGEYGTIRITAEKDDENLYIHVIDDGIGMDETELANVFSVSRHDKTNMTGVGVRNVDERLKLTYGPSSGLSFESEKGKGTTVTVKLPLEE